MISIITPHYAGTNPYIKDSYNTLLSQTIQDWEWVIVRNNGGILPEDISNDRRVKVVDSDSVSIGTLKKLACKNASGSIVVELDADDLLLPEALEEINQAFTPGISFVYSNSAEFHEGIWQPRVFSEYFGWKNRPFKYQGRDLVEMIAFEPSPHALRTIWWSPNHVRAWRAKDYWAIGGHDESLPVADDHDLCCRFYLHGKMKHIDKCLYLYRLHDENTCNRDNARVQELMWRNYSRYIIPMAEKWVRSKKLGMVDLGGYYNKPEGYTGIDIRENSDVQYDLNKGIPAQDNSLGIIRAHDILEHLQNPVAIMNECYRTLAPGGWLNISVPSTDGRGAFQDPTHISFWNANSFWYYTDNFYRKFVPQISCQFQVSRILTWFPSEWHKNKNISYVDAQLIAVKPGYQPIGEVL